MTCLIFLCCFYGIGQIDSLEGVPLARIMDMVYVQSDSSSSVELSNYLTKKARIQKDSGAVSWGHYGNYLYNSEPVNLKYLDSLIFSTIGLGTVEEIFGLTTNGDHYFIENDFKKALTYYLQARHLSLKTNNENYLKYVTGALANIKFLAGEYSESLNLYHTYGKMGPEDLLQQYFNLANCHYELNNVDSLRYYSTIGIKKSITGDDEENYGSFLRLNGISHYLEGNYRRALDSLKKSRTLQVDSIDLGNSLYFTALSFDAIGQKDSTIAYFEKIASLDQEPEIYFPEIKNVYIRLYENAKKEDAQDQQLLYIEKFMITDSVLQAKSIGLLSRIDKEYDLPVLEEKRGELQGALKTRGRLTYAVIFLSMALVATLVFFLTRFMKQKKRLAAAKGNPENYLSSIVPVKPIFEPKKNEIPSNLILQLDKYFDKFEKEEKFLNGNMTLKELADLSDTNTAYLSRYLNTFKGGYTDYINGLRTRYAFRDMASNEEIRIFTLDYIAKLYGFPSLRAFNRAFEKYLKIKPKDYLAQFK